jgi:hypothetical protein
VSAGPVTVAVEVRNDAQAQFEAALRHFSLLLIWLDRGRPRPLCIDGREYHRKQRARRGRKNRG